MRLKSLYIEDYKNIQKQTFDFSSNTGYIALIGENGSGKSNLLEAISLIFNGIFNKKKIPFDYSIEYEMNRAVYKHKKGKAYKENAVIKNEEMLYPSSVIACYSGEDMRLWHRAYEDYYNHFFNKAKDENYFVTQMLYVNRYCWQIALISLLCNDSSSDFLKSCLGIDDISKIEISFEYNDAKKDMFKKHDALSWFNRIVSEGNAVNAKTLATTDIASSSATTMKQEKSKTIFQYLFLLSMPKKNDVNKVDKLITKIQIKIGDIDFDDLSEGEKKLILIECITKVLGDENSLILLDEPDAHTHVARKKELLSTIESFEGQTIMTTHSPVFVGMIKDFDNSIYPIEDGKQISKNKKDLIRQISNDEISYIDGAYISSSKNILVTEGPDDIKYIKAAIDFCSKKDNKYKPLSQIPFLMQGGAKMVNEINETILSKFEDEKQIVFLFDYDQEGREGAQMVEKLNKSNIKYCYYFKEYPIPDNSLDFYLEDFFDDSVYPEIQIPQINGKAKYYEMKKLGSLAESVKKKIKKKIEAEEIQNFDGFNPLLDKLLELFGL